MMGEDHYYKFNHKHLNLRAHFCCMGDAEVNKDVSENSCDEQLTGVAGHER